LKRIFPEAVVPVWLMLFAPAGKLLKFVEEESQVTVWLYKSDFLVSASA